MRKLSQTRWQAYPGCVVCSRSSMDGPSIAINEESAWISINKLPQASSTSARFARHRRASQAHGARPRRYQYRCDRAAQTSRDASHEPLSPAASWRGDTWPGHDRRSVSAGRNRRRVDILRLLRFAESVLPRINGLQPTC
jgi:hypothetical protein